MLNAQIANLSSKLEYAIECKKRKGYVFRFLSDMTELLDLISDIDCKADDEGVNMLQNMDESMDSDSVINLSKTALKKISSGLQSTKVSCRRLIVANGVSAVASVAVSFISPIALLNLAVGGGNIGAAAAMKKVFKALDKADSLLSKYSSLVC